MKRYCFVVVLVLAFFVLSSCAPAPPIAGEASKAGNNCQSQLNGCLGKLKSMAAKNDVLEDENEALHSQIQARDQEIADLQQSVESNAEELASCQQNYQNLLCPLLVSLQRDIWTGSDGMYYYLFSGSSPEVDSEAIYYNNTLYLMGNSESVTTNPRRRSYEGYHYVYVYNMTTEQYTVITQGLTKITNLPLHNPGVVIAELFLAEGGLYEGQLITLEGRNRNDVLGKYYFVEATPQEVEDYRQRYPAIAARLFSGQPSGDPRLFVTQCNVSLS